MTSADTLRDQNLAQKIKSAWIKRRGMVVEIKRWLQQFLMMIGAVPYMVLIGSTFARFDNTKSAWVTFAFLIFFALYYVLSAYLHFRIDKKIQFKNVWWLSPRIFLAALSISFTRCYFFCEEPNTKAFIKSFEEQLPGGDAVHFLFYGIGGLHLSSVLLTWVLSEWFCRLRNRYQVKNWRIFGGSQVP
jgi:hypothetical protein